MASEETVAIAQMYLDKHAVPEEKFGLGPYLETGTFGFMAASRVIKDGSMAIELLNDRYNDCRTIAERMQNDIAANNPELKPEICWYSDRGVHNWVEITDPQTGERVQIDATPWYNQLNPGHVGSTNLESNKVKVLKISNDGGTPFSVKTVGEKTISVYIYGSLPRISLTEKIALARKLIEDEKSGRVEKGTPVDPRPEYRFVLAAVLAPHFGDIPEDIISFYVNVPDSLKLQQAIGTATSIDDLVTVGVIEIGITFPGINKDIKFSSLDAIRNGANEVGQGNLFAEIEGNLGRMMILLRRASPTLHIYGRTQMIDVSSGCLVMQIQHILCELASGHKPALARQPDTFQKNISPDLLSSFTRFMEARIEQKNNPFKPKIRPMKLGSG